VLRRQGAVSFAGFQSCESESARSVALVEPLRDFALHVFRSLSVHMATVW
jgi:hypothetical protein